MKKTTEELIFPIIVAAVSLIGIIRGIDVFFLTSLITSLLGIAASILFFFNKKGAPALFYTWIILQMVTFISPDFALVTNPIPELFLGINIDGADYLLNINFAPMFYFIGYRLLLAFNVVGKDVSINPIKVDSPLKKMEGTIAEYSDLNGDGKWYKVELSTTEIVFIKPKEITARFTSKHSILGYVKRYDAEKKKYVFIDWGKIRLK